MRFLTDSQLEEYYGTFVDNISPTAEPLSEYMNGRESVACPSCGADCDVLCGEVDNRTEFVEMAFCDACEMLMTRPREPVVDELKYQYQHHRTDERDEYVCRDCKERHPLTVPNGDWRFHEQAEIGSLETVYVDCPCGRAISVNQVEFPATVTCHNDDCSRVYEFGVQESS